MRLLCLIVVAMSCVGCVSVPPEAVVSQELVLEGIRTARRNQITLINAYAADQKENSMRLLRGDVLDDVIRKEMNGREGLPAEAVKKLMLEYAEDCAAEGAEIDKTHAELLETAVSNFRELEELANLNLEYMKSVSKATEWQQKLLIKYKSSLSELERKFAEWVEQK